MSAAPTMTRSERSELGALIRKRERVMKAAAKERSSQLMAEIDRQLAQIYAFDNDAIWAEAVRLAKEAVEEAKATIAERCRALGIPAEFPPGISFDWYGRNQNAAASRRAELRRAASSRAAAIEAEAITKIERLSLAAQTEIVVNGLESAAAREFLERLPSIETLMPPLDVSELKTIVESRRAA